MGPRLLVSSPISISLAGGQVCAVYADNEELPRAMIRTVLGVKRAYSGRIIWNDSLRDASWPRRISYILPDAHLSPRLTVGQLLRRAIDLRLWRSTNRSTRREILRDALTFWKLEGEKDVRLGQCPRRQMMFEKLVIGKKSRSNVASSTLNMLSACSDRDGA